MSISTKIRRGEGPFWGSLKALALGVLRAHVPVGTVGRPAFAALYGLHVGAREGLAWAARFFWYEPLLRSQCESVGAGLQMEGLPYITGRGRIALGAGVRLSGKSSICFGNRHADRPEFVVGDRTFIGHNCGFSACESIRIGADCLLASEVRIQDNDGHPVEADLRRRGDPVPSSGVRPVVLGDDVWVGARATILKGVRIGDRSIVGAASVVTRDVPPDAVVAGNPARVIRRLGDGARGAEDRLDGPRRDDSCPRDNRDGELVQP